MMRPPAGLPPLGLAGGAAAAPELAQPPQGASAPPGPAPVAPPAGGADRMVPLADVLTLMAEMLQKLQGLAR